MEKLSKKSIDLRKNFNVSLLKSEALLKDLKKLKLPKDFSKELKSLKENKTYEEVVCVSYQPKNSVVHATVKLKQDTGYNGSPCTNGSFEHVRFYVDYNRDGNWVDEGHASFKVFDFGLDTDLCFNVNKKISPDKRTCCDKKPVLPKVRAILSWQVVPPANQPDWKPYWGNVNETNIQIEPRHGILCYLDDLTWTDKLIEVDTVLKQKFPNLLSKSYALKDQLDLIKKHKIEPSRFAFKELSKKVQSKTITPLNVDIFPGDIKIDYPKILDFLLKPKFNTTYEELTCVALNRNATTLHGTVHIKRAAGYSGSLCQNGSEQYVAFYMDFGSGWEYMGTESVTTHDIPEIPNDGLDYNVVLPVDLDKKRKEYCDSGKAKLKGILSWNVAPPPNQPNFVAHWGDWEQCDVEIESLPEGVPTGQTSLKIETLGSMHIPDINQITGLANGPDALGIGFTADESPFDGRINFTGSLINGSSSNFEYRLLVTPPASGTSPLLNHITAEKIGFTGETTLVPDADGWMPHTKLVGNLLGFFNPSVSGLHTLEIQVRDVASSIVLPYGNTINFMVHKEGPVVDIEITSGSGNCGSFSPGDVMSGSYSVVSDYPRYMSISVTPHPEAAPGVISIDGAVGSSLSYPTNLIAPGKSGNWDLNTAGMPNCGYNIWLRCYDRTIMHSKSITRQSPDVEGFCLIS